MTELALQRLNQIAELNIDIKNEQTVKHSIVIPFLECFGYDKLTLEHASQGSRIDVNFSDKIIIETKSANKSIDDYLDQVKRYCDTESPLIAIISNGNEFKVFSPFWRKVKEFRDRVIFYFNRKDLGNLELIEKLEKILSKFNLENDIAEQNLMIRETELHKLNQTIEEIEENKNNKIAIIDREVLELKNKIQEMQDELQNKNKFKEEVINQLELSKNELKSINFLPTNTQRSISMRTVSPPHGSNVTKAQTILKKGANYQLNDTKKGLIAHGILTEQKTFIAKVGSMFIKEVTDNFNTLKKPSSTRKFLFDNGYFELIENRYYTLIKDYEFSSISLAASIILGRSSNGKKEFQKID